jgi:hypothetical protein
VIAAAQLMIVLDATIVNVALPHMQQALASAAPASSGRRPIRWPAPVALGGRLGDMYIPQDLHRRPLIFSLGSLAGSFDSSVVALAAPSGAGAALAAPTRSHRHDLPMGAPAPGPSAWRAGSGAGGRSSCSSEDPHQLRLVALGVLRQRSHRCGRRRAGSIARCHRSDLAPRYPGASRAQPGWRCSSTA